MNDENQLGYLCNILNMTAIPSESKPIIKEENNPINQTNTIKKSIKPKKFKKREIRKKIKSFLSIIYGIIILSVIIIILLVIIGGVLFCAISLNSLIEKRKSQQFEDFWIVECDSEYIQWSYEESEWDDSKFGRLYVAIVIFIPQNPPNSIYQLNFNTQISDLTGFQQHRFSFALYLPDTATIILQRYNDTSERYDIIAYAFFSPTDNWEDHTATGFEFLSIVGLLSTIIMSEKILKRRRKIGT